MRFLKEWDNIEGFNGVDEVTKRVISVFSKWERRNLIITYGRRERNTEYTYGFPYTSSSSFAMISNCNVEATLKGTKDFTFQWLAITEDLEIVACFTDYVENEKYITIGRIVSRYLED